MNFDFSHVNDKNSCKYNISNNDFDDNNFLIVDSLVFNDNKDTNVNYFNIISFDSSIKNNSDNNSPRSNNCNNNDYNNPIYKPKNV